MKTKFYRVCRSGKTIDGREITPLQIDQMAETYDPQKYGARVNCEHLLSLLPAGTPFQAYGDVLALKAETDEEGARVLLAQLDVTDELVKLNKARQKVYFSIEMIDNFAGTGKAYMVGLAVTDTPASLGTELIKLTAKHAADFPDTTKKLTGHLFSEPVEVGAIEEDTGAAPAPAQPEGPSILARVKDILSGKKVGDDARFSQIDQALTALASTAADLQQTVTNLAAAQAGAATNPGTTGQPQPDDDTGPVSRKEFNALVKQLQESPNTPPRQLHNGGGAAPATDC